MVHSIFFTFESFRDSVNQEQDEKIKELTCNLCLLFGISAITYSPSNSAIISGGFVTG